MSVRCLAFLSDSNVVYIFLRKVCRDMKYIVMILSVDIFPVRAGHHKAMYEFCKYLHHVRDIRLKLLVISRSELRMEGRYMDICDEVVWVKIPRKWSVPDIINKIGIRFLRQVNCELGWSMAMKRKVRKECLDADAIIVNYAMWYNLLDERTLATKTVVITHDIFFYRRASFGRMRNCYERFWQARDRKAELRVLSKFYRICVFADYEVKLLLDGNIPKERILKIGLPIDMETPIKVGVRKEYDFISVGSNIYQNVEGLRCFFDRVVPLLGKREIKLAIAGELASCELLDSSIVPSNVIVFKIGCVNDLSDVFSRSLIGVGTVPYGSGIKVKVVEMVMNGLPVIVTNSGAEGIPLVSDGNINIDAEPIEEVQNRLFAWLNDPVSATKIGMHQGMRLRNDFAPSTCMKPLCDLVMNI